jgi:hypothetical protein
MNKMIDMTQTYTQGNGKKETKETKSINTIIEREARAEEDVQHLNHIPQLVEQEDEYWRPPTRS